MNELDSLLLKLLAGWRPVSRTESGLSTTLGFVNFTGQHLSVEKRRNRRDGSCGYEVRVGFSGWYRSTDNHEVIHAFNNCEAEAALANLKEIDNRLKSF